MNIWITLTILALKGNYPMEVKKSGFQREQLRIVEQLRKHGHLKAGRLARQGSKVQQLVTRLRNTPGRTIYPITCIEKGYTPVTVHQALSRMVIVGEAERTFWGSYKIINPAEDGSG